MKIIGEKLSQQETLNLKGGCDLECYCGSLWTIISGGESTFEAVEAAVQAWNDHDCSGGLQQ